MSNTQLQPINKQPATKSDNRRSINNFLQVAGILPILVLICILFSVLSPNF
jgi:ribose transport system permease protein